jgi:ribosomal protein S12 methylthiotransferase
MGAFAYSDEDGTYAHTHYTDDIPQQVKQRRLEQLMALQQEIADEQAGKMIGTTQRVLIDREEDDYYVGRTEKDSPEVDCEVLIKRPIDGKECKTGEIYDVRITDAETFDFYAELI